MNAASPPTDAASPISLDFSDMPAAKITHKKKATKKSAFVFSNAEQLYGAVPIPVHKSDKAFKRYLRETNYVEEILEAMGKSKGSDDVDPSAGAKRLL